MEAFLQQFQDLRIELEEITSATNNFDDKNYIGGGGFGKVYKGKVSHSRGRSLVAIKRLDRRHGQGKPEFLKEILALSRYNHEYLISLLGYCYQRNEMILVYEYASRGSLDYYLNSPHLTWSQRLKICLDAAKGLSYLHDPRGTHQRIIHCDVKSANILLDEQWSAKLSDFGLSIMGPANEPYSVIVTLAAGTPGYCDPQYAMTHTLTKESDVYSFGVVLFEVLCGTLCYTYQNGCVPEILLPMWIENYKQNQLDDIVFNNPANPPMDQGALKIFSNIAYECLKESREDRPKMSRVVTELETALAIQELNEGKLSRLFYFEMVNTAHPPLNCRSIDELKKRLYKGVLLDDGKKLFSINKKGEHIEMIYHVGCLDSRYLRTYNLAEGKIQTHVKTQFLSPGVTYAINLVFRFAHLDKVRKCTERVYFKYKLQGETKTAISRLAYERDCGWWICELYQFTSDHRIVDLEIFFEDFFLHTSIHVEGIEFRPLERVDNKDEKQPMSYYEDTMTRSKNKMQWTKKNEAYSFIHQGFLFNHGREWFSLDKNGKKCHMLSARAARVSGNNKYWLSLPDSRFGEALELNSWMFSIHTKIQAYLVSSQTTYATYLVYKIPKDQSWFEDPMIVEDEESVDDYYRYIYLVSPQTPVIRPKAEQNTHNPLSRLNIKGLPRERNDGWMEVQIWEFQTATIIEENSIRLRLFNCGDKKLSGLIIQGVEFKPC